MFKLSNYIVQTKVPESSKVILFSTRTSSVLVVDESTMKLLENKEFHHIENRDLKKLTESKIIIHENEQEIDKVLKLNNIFNENEDTISFTIQPTANCQLGCHYCGQNHVKKNIDDDTIMLAIKRVRSIIKKNNYKKLVVTWYGGEPLLAIKQIETYSKELFKICAEFNLKYEADIITNGLILKPHIYKKLLELNVSLYQITVDGTEETHDKRRITKKGAATFNIIYNNLVRFAKDELYKKYNAKVNLRINIDRSNVEYVDSLIDRIYTEGILHDIVMTFAPVEDWGGNEADKNSLSFQEFAEYEIQWYIKLIQLGKTNFEFIPGLVSSACMVSTENSEVFDAYGNIYACYEYSYTDKYTSDPLCSEGTLQTIDNDVKKSPSAIRNFKNTVVDKKYSNCIECIYFPVCNGACPKQWMNGKIACPSFKFNMEDKLLLNYYVHANAQ